MNITIDDDINESINLTSQYYEK